jgi:hypothetical protein
MFNTKVRKSKSYSIELFRAFMHLHFTFMTDFSTNNHPAFQNIQLSYASYYTSPHLATLPLHP